MAETRINTTIADAPMVIPTSVANIQSAVMASGVAVVAPVVALAYSYAVLMFNGDNTNAGTKITVSDGTHSMTVTLDANGAAVVSILPLIRAGVMGSNTLNNPLDCSGAGNNYRGTLHLTLTEGEDAPTELDVRYIFGNYAPKVAAVTDIYRDYDPDGETWCSVDAASNYDIDGAPVDFNKNWVNINEILANEPDGDFYIEVDSADFNGIEEYTFSTVHYHFRNDCRRDNIVKLRWLDTDGNINTRKFVVAGRHYGAAASSTWQLPQPLKLIVDDYKRGRDQWGNISASETLSIGDDNIPIAHYDWVKTLASAPAVDAFLGGLWTRVNINEATMECDPRRPIFSVSLTLALPTDDVQQF